MNIYIPQELKDIPDLEADLRFFFDLMVRKLHLNRHKGFVKGKELEDLYQKLLREIEELRVARVTSAQFDVTLECVDISNFAFLISMYCLHLVKPDFLEERNRNGYDRIASAKTEEIVRRSPMDRNTENTTTKRG